MVKQKLVIINKRISDWSYKEDELGKSNRSSEEALKESRYRLDEKNQCHKEVNFSEEESEREERKSKNSKIIFHNISKKYSKNPQIPQNVELQHNQIKLKCYE